MKYLKKTMAVLMCAICALFVVVGVVSSKQQGLSASAYKSESFTLGPAQQSITWGGFSTSALPTFTISDKTMVSVSSFDGNGTFTFSVQNNYLSSDRTCYVYAKISGKTVATLTVKQKGITLTVTPTTTISKINGNGQTVRYKIVGNMAGTLYTNGATKVSFGSNQKGTGTYTTYVSVYYPKNTANATKKLVNTFVSYSVAKTLTYTQNIHTHTYGSWIVAKQPTCAAYGSKYHVCTICNKTVTQTIAKKAHTGNLSYNGDTEEMKYTCTKCYFVDMETSYSEYLSYDKLTDTEELLSDYYKVVLRAICRSYEADEGKWYLYDEEELERCANQMASVKKNANASSNILVHYERPNCHEDKNDWEDMIERRFEESGYGKFGGFLTQAKEMADYAYDNENCFFLAVTYTDQFLYLWNEIIPATVSNIHLFLHGGVYVLNFHNNDLYGEQFDLTEEEIASDTLEHPLVDMNSKNIRHKVYLYSCNGGTYDSSGKYDSPKSMARAFAKLCPNAEVVALKDAGVDYNAFTELPESHLEMDTIGDTILPDPLTAHLGSWISETYRTSGFFDTRKIGFIWRL